ncbi:LytR C-terminal domain-containing protein [uncultured Nocardioides sp.]|uniref:LytR C-terminal domain-containing protein n=1 Tax=uncultured Nocardioides sp. TaxID=198441 RepID=UPI0026272078|nr:LytR C-terminal domain-containing protein [uncultured Nocardioides sp.]
MSGRHVRDERGVAFPSPLVLLSIVAVAMAGLAFLVTSGDDEADQARVVTSTPSSTPSASPSPTEQPSRTPKPKPSPKPVERGEVFVEVYNNSGITGLAAGFSETAAAAGWQVVGSDNWVGTIPSSTVYFPPRLEREAESLARDLGISRLMPAVAPMRFDRLTVILTGDVA